jgi:hypothetical protein
MYKHWDLKTFASSCIAMPYLKAWYDLVPLTLLDFPRLQQREQQQAESNGPNHMSHLASDLDT